MKRSPGRDRRTVSPADSGSKTGQGICIMNAVNAGLAFQFYLIAIRFPYPDEPDPGFTVLDTATADLDPQYWALDDAGTLVACLDATLVAGELIIGWEIEPVSPSPVIYYLGGDSIFNSAAGAIVPPMVATVTP